MGRKPKRPRASAPKASDQGTDQFQARNKGNLYTSGKAKRLISQTPLDYYFRSKKTITGRQYKAGCEFYKDFRLGGLEPSLVPSYALISMSGGGSGSIDKNMMAKTEGQLFHRQRYRAARESITENTGKLLVENVCSFGFMLADLHFSYYTSSLVMIPPFKAALDELADYYGLPKDCDNARKDTRRGDKSPCA